MTTTSWVTGEVTKAFEVRRWKHHLLRSEEDRYNFDITRRI
jgi:hypothetical protein